MPSTADRSAAPSPPSHRNTPKLVDKHTMLGTQNIPFLARPGVILILYFLLLAIPLSYIITRLISNLFSYLGYTTILKSQFGILLHRFSFIGLNLFCLVWWASILEEEEEERSKQNVNEAINSPGNSSNLDKSSFLQWIEEETARYEREIARMEASMNDYHSPHMLTHSSSSSRDSSSSDSRINSAYESNLSDTKTKLDAEEAKQKKKGYWNKSLMFRGGKIIRVDGAIRNEKEESVMFEDGGVRRSVDN